MKSIAIESVDFFKNLIKNIEDVIKIAYSIDRNLVTIWTFSKKSNRRILYKIYNIEQTIIDKYPSLEFDFKVALSTDESIPPNLTIEVI